MDRALDAGINVFDTADAYGGGRSETFIGRWLKPKGSAVRDHLVLSSKVFNPVGPGPNDRGPLPRPHPTADRREPDTASDRSARPVPDSRARSRDAARGNAGRARRLRPRRQGALHRREQHRGVAAGARRSGSASARGWRASTGCRTLTACSIGAGARDVSAVRRRAGRLHRVQSARRRLADGQVPGAAERIPKARA